MDTREQAYQREYRAQHRDERRAYNAAYWASHREEKLAYRAAHREKMLAYGRSYGAAHREEQRAYHDAYNAAHREKQCAGAVAWRLSHPEEVRNHHRNRRAQLSNAPGRHTAAEVARIRAEQGNKCFWCGEPLGRSYHVDHYIPLSKGGSNWPENLDMACARCNLRKKDLMPGEFLERLA